VRPGYRTMGQDGMGDMGEMGMKPPRNSIPMGGDEGPFDYITMRGMFAVLKVREGNTNYEDPGWYKHPEGTVASVASPDELKRDGINLPKDPPKAASARPVITGEAWCGRPPKIPLALAQSRLTARNETQ